MKREFGFSTKDLTTLNEDLLKLTNGIMPGPKDFHSILIEPNYDHLDVHVVIYTDQSLKSFSRI